MIFTNLSCRPSGGEQAFMNDTIDFNEIELNVISAIKQMDELPFKLDLYGKVKDASGKISMFFNLKAGEVLEYGSNIKPFRQKQSWFDLIGYTTEGKLMIKRTSGSYQRLEYMPLKEIVSDDATIDLFSTEDGLIIGMIFGLIANEVLKHMKKNDNVIELKNNRDV
jgi:hypothetical protein